MKKILPFLFLLALAACKNYGKKVSPKDSKGEVYYKGEGVTESDAQKLADYLNNEVEYFNNTTRMSVQLTKAEGEGYDIRFVVNEEKVKQNPEQVDKMADLGAALSIDIFNNKPVNVILTDDHFKAIKTMPFDAARVEKLKQGMMQKQAEGENTTEPATTEPADTTQQ